MKYCITLALTITLLHCFAQEKELNFDRIADELVTPESEDDGANTEAQYENLTLLLSNPIDLNKISEEELRQFYFLSERQVREFFKYRREQGEFVSTYELQAVPEFDPETLALLTPFVKVTDKQDKINASLLNRILTAGNSYLITRVETSLEEKAGYSDSLDSEDRYQGSDYKLFTRFRTAAPYDYSIGFTLEKDAGETITWNPSKRKFGGDYSSAHIQLINKGRLKNLIVGDYQAQFAQGVVLGGAFGLGKSAETITTTRRTNLGFTSHTSAAESGFYRGAAATYQLTKFLLLSAFYSRAIRDATLSFTDNDTLISAFQYSGMHRNENEKSKQRNARESIIGSVLNFKSGSFNGGLLFQKVDFEYNVEKTANIYNQFSFQGATNVNAGIFYNYNIQNFCLFGEAARSIDGGSAVVAGILGSLTTSLDLSLLYRNYTPDYFAFYANPFSENTQPQNEAGFYWGIKYRWNRRWTLSSYMDFFKFPWLSFRRYAPTTGNEWLMRLTYQPARKIMVFAQAKQENKTRNISEETTQFTLASGKKTNYQASFNYAEGILRLRTRIQYSTYRLNNNFTDGIVLLQGVGFEIGKFGISGHTAIFQTDDFDNRQYVYENDVYLVFSLPSYDGTGSRSMLMIDYKISRQCTVYARFSRSFFTNKEEIGTGLDTITGNSRNDLKFQAVLRF